MKAVGLAATAATEACSAVDCCAGTSIAYVTRMPPALWCSLRRPDALAATPVTVTSAAGRLCVLAVALANAAREPNPN